MRKGEAGKPIGHPKESRVEAALEAFSGRVTKWVGGSFAFAIAFAVILVWGITGPIFQFSDTWQLVINTSTTIVTFLMVFLIQRSQNKDAMAIQLKLNEIVAALDGASNLLIDIEDLSETELRTLHVHYQKLAEMAKHASHVTESHSIDEAEERHKVKSVLRKKRKRVAEDAAG
jgi:low affinity Fe/Cu permease